MRWGKVGKAFVVFAILGLIALCEKGEIKLCYAKDNMHSKIEIMEVGAGFRDEKIEKGKEWYGLFETNEEYVIRKTKILEIKMGVGLDVVSHKTQENGTVETFIRKEDEWVNKIELDQSTKPIFLFNGIQGTIEGRIKTVFSGNLPLDVGTRFYLDMGKDKNKHFDCHNYLVVYGDVEEIKKDYQEDRKDYRVTKYKINFNDQELVSIKQLASNEVAGISADYPKLIWAGDLDKDGKMDLLLDTQLDDYPYECDSNYVLFLSSFAEKGQSVKKVAEYTVNYICD